MKSITPLLLWLLLAAATSTSAQTAGTIAKINQPTTTSVFEKLLFLVRPGAGSTPKKATRLYLEEAWFEGRVLDLEDSLHRVSLRYRIFDDEMQMLLRDQVYTLFPQSMQALYVNKRIFVPAEYEAGQSEIRIGYFELLAEGRITLLKRHTLKGKKVRESLYYAMPGKVAIPLSNTKRTLLAQMSDQQPQIEAFCQQHGVRWNEEEQLIRTVEYYNQLSR
jgi:hypothetical protein